MQRIDSLDVLRGLALLGLPLMNLVAFSMPFMAYSTPQAFHGDNGLNHFWFSLFYVLADQKFMGLFSILFGAGIALLYEKFNTENKEKPRGGGTIYIRLFVLLFFGYLHMTYLWSGDVLMIYAAWGMVLFPFVGASVKGLTTWFVVFYALVILFSLFGMSLNPEALSEEVQQQLMFWLIPTAEQIELITQVYRGSMDDIVTFESTLTVDGKPMDDSVVWLLFMEACSGIFRAGAMIAFGFLLYKNGFLTGSWSTQRYKQIAIFGISVGIVISTAGLLYNYNHDYSDPFKYFGIGSTVIIVSSPFMILGYIALVHCLLKGEVLSRWSKPVANVGRMALTMYLMQSFIGVFIFWGVGLGWFASVDRTGLVIIAIGIGALQLSLATLWLKLFAYGPTEWLWRCLTYRSFVSVFRSRNPELA